MEYDPEWDDLTNYIPYRDPLKYERRRRWHLERMYGHFVTNNKTALRSAYHGWEVSENKKGNTLEWSLQEIINMYNDGTWLKYTQTTQTND